MTPSFLTCHRTSGIFTPEIVLPAVTTNNSELVFWHPRSTNAALALQNRLQKRFSFSILRTRLSLSQSLITPKSLGSFVRVSTWNCRIFFFFVFIKETFSPRLARLRIAVFAFVDVVVNSIKVNELLYISEHLWAKCNIITQFEGTPIWSGRLLWDIS